MSAPATKAIVIGASAGAVEALLAILPALPAQYPLPLLVVVHVPPDRRNVLVPLFETRCQMAVKEAEDKEPVTAGTVYFAPADYHLLVEEEDFTLSLSSDEAVNYSRPSIDVLFESAADAYGSGLMGIILTGANHDGAAGLAAVERAGGSVIVEDPAGAHCGEMPSAAAAACRAAKSLSIADITAHLLKAGAA